MNRIGRFFYRVFFWTYNRGSWQWDLMCLFFLIIIFGIPRNFLEKYSTHPMTPAEIYSFLIDSLKAFF
jgi:hypothetical protein